MRILQHDELITTKAHKLLLSWRRWLKPDAQLPHSRAHLALTNPLDPPPELHVPHGLFDHIFSVVVFRSVSFYVSLRLCGVVFERILLQFVDLPGFLRQKTGFWSPLQQREFIRLRLGLCNIQFSELIKVHVLKFCFKNTSFQFDKSMSQFPFAFNVKRQICFCFLKHTLRTVEPRVGEWCVLCFCWTPCVPGQDAYLLRALVYS